MGPPSFSDLGKAAMDLFSKGYHLGVFRIDASTKTQNNIELSASIVSNRESGKVSGNVESKYKWSEYGLTFTENWTTENVITAEVKVEDQIAEGLELAVEVSFAPQSGEKTCTLKSEYQMEYLHVNGDVDLDLAGPNFTGAAVLGCEGWLAGYQLGYDTSQSKLTSSNFGFGYVDDDFSFTTVVDEGQEFTGAVYHKVNEKLEAAVMLSWATDSGNTTFGIGGRYNMDEDVSFGAKVDNESNIGFSYTQTLKNEVKFTISTLIDGKNISQGNHQVGFGIEFEA
uniref:Voltage-dependent anion-selective channel protein 2 n=1 Tax=Arion vulgaris TaxID=1028688 RepID=A0A0B6YAV4_9EUPU